MGWVRRRTPWRGDRTSGRRSSVATLLVVPLAGALALTGALPVAPVAGPPASGATRAAALRDVGPGSRPNIVLVTTDDQRLDDLVWMPRTRRLLGGAGATLGRATSPHPLCCPARVEILTGQYAHNNGVRHNTGPWGGYRAFAATPARRHHLGSWLQEAGYRTGLVGKFLNGYETNRTVQPGWSVWNPLVQGVYRYTDFVMRVGGRDRHYSMRRNRRHYVTDVVGARAATLTRRWAGRRPFFLWISHVAPHTMKLDGRWVPPAPAPRHRDLFADVRLPNRDHPNFNEPDRSDKPRPVRSDPRWGVPRLTTLFRQRIRSLQAVDEATGRLVRALAESGELASTVIVFTSDNGYLLGEHGLVGKNWAYEAGLRVPMLVRGPGVPAGVHRDQQATVVDLPSTFLSLAGATRPGRDGADLWSALATDAPTTDTGLVQAGSEHRPWRWRGVRTDRYVYVTWGGVRELYDLQTDPFQTENLLTPAGELRDEAYASVLAELRARFAQRAECSGAACQQPFGPMPEPVTAASS